MNRHRHTPVLSPRPPARSSWRLACWRPARSGRISRRRSAPQTTGFVPPGELPAETAVTPLAGGTAQHFVDDLDIQGQWWTLFQSPELNSLIERVSPNNPTLAAASAALRQARETFEAGTRRLLSGRVGLHRRQREKVSGAALGLPQAGSVIYTLNSATLNVSYTLDVFGGVRRQVEALRRASRISTIRARGGLLEPDRQSRRPRRSPKPRCAPNWQPRKRSRTRNKNSSISPNGVLKLAAPRASMCFSSRPSCKARWPACPRCEPTRATAKSGRRLCGFPARGLHRPRIQSGFPDAAR